MSEAFLNAPNALLPPQVIDQTGAVSVPEVPQPPQPPAPVPYPGNEGELLTQLVRWFETAEDATSEARRLAEQDRDYYDGKQLTSEELEALRKRGQPPTIINYIKRKIDLMRGLERRARTDPKALPRTPNEDKRADAATQALRFVADDCEFDEVRSSVYEDLLVPGTGGAETVVEPGQGMDVKISSRHIPWDRLFHDPHSRRLDFSDARYLGIVIWQDRDEVLEMFPGGEAALDGTFGAEGQGSGTYQDRPANGVFWCDNLKKRARVVQIFWRERGEWWEATYTKGGFLSPAIQSPYLGRDGKSRPRLRMRSAYIDRNNMRYGMVRDMISLQDEVNKRRSKALHLLTAAPIIAEQGAVIDVDQARQEAAKPDGYIEVTPGMRFEIARGGDLASGQFQLLQHATAEMQAQGANASLAGKDSRDLSGRAIIAQQAGGQAEIEPLADALRSWARGIHEDWWCCIRQFWQGEKWVRVTDDDGGTKFIGLNRQVTGQEHLMSLSPEEAAQELRAQGFYPGHPGIPQYLSSIVRTENNVSDLEVDITIESGPDVPTLAAEEFQMLSQMIPPMLPAMPPPVQMKLFAMMVTASNLRNKDKLTDILDEVEQMASQPPPPPPPPPPGVLELQQANVRKTNAQAAAQEAAAADRQAAAVQKVAQVHDQHVAQQAGLAAQEQMGGYPGQVI